MNATPTTVSRVELAAVLNAWSAGQRSAAEVHDWAVQRYATHAYEPEDDVVSQVLGALDQLDMNLLIADDASLLLRALEVAKDEATAASIISAGLDAIDRHARRKALHADPLYSRFCTA